MKRFINFTALIIVLGILTACDHSAGTTANSSQVVASGNWKISQFLDSGNDETGDFNDYVFTFTTGGTVAAVKNGVTTNGTWSINSSSTKFTINFGPKTDANKPLGELTDDWKIITNSNTEIRLTDDNSSSGEFLSFLKN
jgi:hypothetical protein